MHIHVMCILFVYSMHAIHAYMHSCHVYTVCIGKLIGTHSIMSLLIQTSLNLHSGLWRSIDHSSTLHLNYMLYSKSGIMLDFTHRMNYKISLSLYLTNKDLSNSIEATLEYFLSLSLFYVLLCIFVYRLTSCYYYYYYYYCYYYYHCCCYYYYLLCNTLLASTCTYTYMYFWSN